MRALRTCSRLFTTVVVCLLSSVAVVTTVAAQTIASGKWEIELHSGGLLPPNSAGGMVSLPAPGGSFTTAGIYPPPAPPVIVVATSRRESSWYFGDGAVLFNQAATALAANPLAMTGAFAGRMVSLDPVLGSAFGTERRTGSIGARVSRQLTPRLSAELSADYGLAGLEITPANRQSIEATRASFIAAFNGLITSNPGRTLKSLTSTAALDDGSAHQLFTSGALVVNLMTRGPIVPYVTAGAGLNAIMGTLPNVTLKGNYQFQNASGSQINESDNVTVTDARGRRSAAAILGGGLKYHVSPRWGVRFDARVSLSKNSAATILDASPNVVLGTLPAGRLALNSDPTIQFGNSTDPVTSLGVTAVSPSTLSGPPITGLRTLSGSGVTGHGNITAGLFWRF
ncbi:MAG: hypothetical protein ACRD2I_08765 [Vicinamibacterales bacterium]